MQCAESALQSVIGDLSHTYFVGNAPMAHLVAHAANETPDLPLKVSLLFPEEKVNLEIVP